MYLLMTTKCSGNYGNRVAVTLGGYSAFLCLAREVRHSAQRLSPRAVLTHQKLPAALPLNYFEEVAYVWIEAKEEIFQKHLALLLAGQIMPSITALTWKQSIMFYGYRKIKLRYKIYCHEIMNCRDERSV